LTELVDILDAGKLGASQRDRAKSERRTRIVEATCELLREVGIEAFTMKMVAARADVSLSTVYNLFDSKAAVLAKIFDQDLNHFEALVQQVSASDAVARIFEALDVAADLYQADPQFYRAALWRHRDGAGDLGLDATLREPRTRFWQDMVGQALSDACLRPTANPAVLGTLMVQTFGGILADWIAGDISVQEFRSHIKMTFAMILVPFAEPVIASRLLDLIGVLHHECATRSNRMALPKSA
jgi:AcrR family transcriptional regulator